MATAAPPATMRLFTALWPPPAVRDALAALRGGWRWPPGVALTDPAGLHVTLHFLGSVAVTRLPAIARGLAVPAERAELSLREGVQRLWPGGIAVLELEPPEPLRRLHARLATAVAALGLPLEQRPWRPHVTFARKATGAQPGPLPPDLPAWPVTDGYALVRSVPGRGYETLQRYGAEAAR